MRKYAKRKNNDRYGSRNSFRNRDTIKIKPFRFSKVTALIVCAALIAALCFALVSCNRSEAKTHFETCYDIALEFSDDMRTVELQEEVLFTNYSSDTLSSVKFHIYPNAFTEQALRSASASAAAITGVSEKGITDFVESMGKEDFGKIEVLSTKINRKSVDFTISGEDRTILSVDCDLTSGESCTVSIEAEITIPVCAARLGKTPKTVNFSCFYPTLCVYENGAWREEPFYRTGDPFYSGIASFYVTAVMPSDYKIASSGHVADEWIEEGRRAVEIVAENIRDFAMVASKDFKIIDSVTEIGGKEVKVNYYYIEDKNAQNTLSIASDALKTFSEAFGDYPYSHYTVAESPLNAGGMEYGSMVIITPSDRIQTEETVIHETAHQWWYGVVGSDQINSAWLDEGLAEFCAGYYFLLKGNRARYDAYVTIMNSNYDSYSSLPFPSPPSADMEKPLPSFSTESEYVALVYLRGALMYDALLSLIGTEKLNAALSTYYKDNYMKTAGKEQLISAFEKQGIAAKSFIENWVNGSARV